MPPPDVARALLAGLIAGAAAAFATTTIVLVALSRDQRWLRRPPNLAIPLPLAGIALTNGFMLAWTALGLVLGAGVHRIEAERPADGLASPNLLFTAAVAGFAAALLGLGWFVRGRLTWPMWTTTLVVALCFGWLLPWLAV